MSGNAATVETAKARIFEVRGFQVILDSDLASLYEVPTRRINEVMSRNAARFPEDFAFKLNEDEWASLRSHFAISKTRGGRRYAPHVFTEHGVAMLAALLNSDRAVQISVLIVREFVRLRRDVATYAELSKRMLALESATQAEFAQVWQAFTQMLELPEPPERKIGLRKEIS